jgi:acyl-CoA thioester hydrolase
MFKLQIQPGFSDTDALGHINNTRLPVWFENAREPIFRLFTPNLDLKNWPLILAHLSIDFTGQIFFDSPVMITTEIEKIGNSSLTLRQCAWQNEQGVATCSAVMVHFDYKTNRSKAISDELREQLSAHMIHQPEQ